MRSPSVLLGWTGSLLALLACAGTETGIGSDGGSGAGTDGACTISASNYDQTCTVDTDCIGVSTGDFCAATGCMCMTGTINKAAAARYNADVAKTPVGSGAVHPLICPCPVTRSGRRARRS